MHPHLNCPVCKGWTQQFDVHPQKLVSAQEGVSFLVENAGSRNWQALWEKLTSKFNITHKEPA